MAKRGGWGLGIAAALAAVGALAFFTMHRAPTPARPAKPSKAAPVPEARTATVPLGSYGSVVHRNGQELALQIRPLAVVEGPRQVGLPRLNGPREQERIGNVFLRFPALADLANSQQVQRQLALEIETSLNAELQAEHSPWRIRQLHLRPSLGPVPAGD
ncbi:MAG: hypothetical protein U7M05_00600 [Candidatus Igneacidithiobacillus chanchocoensis]